MSAARIRGNDFGGFNDPNDEVDDFAFLSHPQQGSAGYLLGNSFNQTATQRPDDRRLQLLEERRRIEERTLESSKISLGLVYDSEKVGLSTAEELCKQKEQLNGVEEKLDYINSAMRVSQKHLNSMKSLFGGIKGYFSKTPETPLPKNPVGSREGNSSTPRDFDKMKEEMMSHSSANHPALRNRGIDFSPFNDDEEKEENSYTNKSNTSYSQRSKQIENQLDSNLLEIDSGLGRLKNLALGLNTEIEEQNRMLDRITSKTERAEDTVNYQTRQMKNLLR